MFTPLQKTLQKIKPQCILHRLYNRTRAWTHNSPRWKVQREHRRNSGSCWVLHFVFVFW